MIVLLRYCTRSTAFLVLMILFCSCQSSPLEKALNQAGDNRKELEAVLYHYQTEDPDTFKYNAAKFLIENMPYHYAIGGERVEQYDAAYRDMAQVPLAMRDSVFEERMKDVNETQNRLLIDVKNVSAEYLIKHIDRVCNVWRNAIWHKAYTVSQFYNYVLPYRLTTEEITCWQDTIDARYAFLNKSILRCKHGTPFEAEDAGVSNGKIVDCPGASGGKTVEMFEKESAITLTINALVAEDILLQVNYSTDVAGSSCDIYKGESFIKTIALSPTPSMNSFNNTRAVVPLHMDKGENVFIIKNRSGRFTVDMLFSIKTIAYSRSNMRNFSKRLWTISNHATGNYITFDNSKTPMLSRVRLCPRKEDAIKDNDNQVIRMDCMGYESWRIASVKKDSVDLCLDVLNWMVEENAPVMQWKYVDGDNQKWYILPVSKGLYRIASCDGGLCLESVVNPLTKRECIATTTYMGRKTQLWHIDDAGSNAIDDAQAPYGTSIAEAFRICDITPMYEWFQFKGNMPVRATSLLHYMTGNCRDETNMKTHLCRYLGIPATEDFTPQWGNRSLAHMWCVLINPDNKSTLFHIGKTPGRKDDNLVDYRHAKVFRRQYEVNREILSDLSDELWTPQFLQTPTIKDVTEEYGLVSDIERTIPKEYDSQKIAYICVFDNKDWVPAFYGKITDGKACFRKMARNICYMTAVFNNGRLELIGNPYILTKEGKVRELMPDVRKTMDIAVERKYPFFGQAEVFNYNMWGGRFQGSNTGDFAHPTDLFVYNGITNGNWYDYPIKSTKAFQYLRYIGPKASNCNVNEIEFYGTNGRIISGDIIGTEGEKKYEKEKVFDGNILTGFRSVAPDDGWVGMKLKERTTVSRIRFIARNDGNCIEVGDVYELVYWQDGKWKSQGRKKADSNNLTFRKVPSGCLYLVHNLTKGSEERIFTYENGKQIWW